MAQGAFVSFLRRKEFGYAQQIVGDAVGTQAHCAKLMAALCADPKARPEKCLITIGGETTSLKNLRTESLRLQAELGRLVGDNPYSDRQATSLIAALIHHCVAISAVAEDNPTLSGVEDLDKKASELCEMAIALKAMQSAHLAGVAEGLFQAQAGVEDSKIVG